MTALFRKVDYHSIPVADLDAALAFYCDRLGYELIWRDDSAAGSRLPDCDTELVLHTDERPIETDLLVASVPATISRFVEVGGPLGSPDATDPTTGLARRASRPAEGFPFLVQRHGILQPAPGLQDQRLGLRTAELRIDKDSGPWPNMPAPAPPARYVRRSITIKPPTKATKCTLLLKPSLRRFAPKAPTSVRLTTGAKEGHQ